VEETFVGGEIVVDTEADLTSLTEESQSCGGRGDAATGVYTFLQTSWERFNSLLLHSSEKLSTEYQSASRSSRYSAGNFLEMSELAMG